MKNKNIILTLSLSCLAAASLVVAGCSDDDFRNNDNPDPIVDTSKEDVVTTTLDTKTAVFATSSGKLLSAVKMRLENVVTVDYGEEIPADCKLIILDEEAAKHFLESNENFSLLSDYYCKGGMIYLHFPRLNQATVVARLVYDVYNSIPDEGVGV